MQLYIVYTILSFTVLLLSILALHFVSDFTHQIDGLILPDSPKALNDLKKVFCPPMKSMQTLVFSFDLILALYYVFQWPLLDGLKRRFPFFSADLKTIEKADCSNLLLMIIFYLLSKVSNSNVLLFNLQGLALAICFVTISKAIDNINTISIDYSVDVLNKDAIVQLNGTLSLLNSAFGFDMTLLVLMVGNFILNGCTMTKSMRSIPAKHEVAVQ